MTSQTARAFLHPDALLNANTMPHWREAAKMKKALRSWSTMILARELVPVSERSLVTISFGFFDRRKRDPANWSPTSKALVDGLVEGGIFPDDDDRWLAGPLEQIGPLSTCPRPPGLRRVELWLTVSAKPKEVELEEHAGLFS